MEQIAIIYPNVPELAENLQSLVTPDGVERVDIVVPAAGNRAAAYQAAMDSSDARYKVYIDETIRIIDHHILSYVLHAFQKHPDVTILGLSGASELSTPGVSVTSAKRTGCLQGPDGQELLSVGATPHVEAVEALDSWFLATQRDVPWRSDLLHGTAFLGASACCEHRRVHGGETSVVLVILKTACRIAVEGFSFDKSDQNAFLDAYSRELYPLVTVCIPTYQRPAYFREALESVLHQTYRNLDIFVTDDSADDRTEKLIQPYLGDGRITYEHHPEYRLVDNFEHLRTYDNPEAEYVGWLMDDDFYLPDKISRMVEAFRTHPEVSIVTSYRMFVDGEGKPLPEERQPEVFAKEDTVYTGHSFGRITLMGIVNVVGEPSNTLLKKSFIENQRYEWIDIKPEYDCVDIPMWLNFLQKGDVYYFAQPLSCFRMHENNEENNPTMIGGMAIGWAQLILHAWETHAYLESEQDLAQALRKHLKTFLPAYFQPWFPSLPEETRRDYEKAVGKVLFTLSQISEGKPSH